MDGGEIQAQPVVDQLRLVAQLLGLREFRVEMQSVIVRRVGAGQACGPAAGLVALRVRHIQHLVGVDVELDTRGG
jgi:hypothetical protein